ASGVLTFFATSVAAGIASWSQRTGKEIGPGDVEAATWAIAELGRSFTAPQFFLAREQVLVHSRRIAEWWTGGFDLLLTPTLPEPPPPLGHFRGLPENPLEGLLRGASFAMLCAPFNATGQPAITLPLGRSSDGLPVGVQLVAAYGREDLLIRVASQLEQATPWADRWPAVSP
ncbi:MAG: amidase family protein, partial [Actinomycetota bacterium]